MSLKFSEKQLINKAIKLVAGAKVGDPVLARAELDELQAQPNLPESVCSFLGKCTGLVDSYGLRTPAERNTPLLENSFRDLREMAENSEEMPEPTKGFFK